LCPNVDGHVQGSEQVTLAEVNTRLWPPRRSMCPNQVLTKPNSEGDHYCFTFTCFPSVPSGTCRAV